MQDDSINTPWQTCNRCGESFPLTLQHFGVNRARKNGFMGICKPCATARANEYKERHHEKVLVYKRTYQREYRRRNPDQQHKWREANRDTIGSKDVQRQKEWRKLNPVKRQAHQALERAVKRGEIRRPESCTACERSEKIEAHHPDYAKPLDVVWLCARCHRKTHSKYS